MSAKDNYSTSAVLTEDKSIGQGDYNWLYYRPEKDDSKTFNGGTLRVGIYYIRRLCHGQLLTESTRLRARSARPMTQPRFLRSPLKSEQLAWRTASLSSQGINEIVIESTISKLVHGAERSLYRARDSSITVLFCLSSF